MNAEREQALMLDRAMDRAKKAMVSICLQFAEVSAARANKKIPRWQCRQLKISLEFFRDSVVGNFSRELLALGVGGLTEEYARETLDLTEQNQKLPDSLVSSFLKHVGILDSNIYQKKV